MSGTTLECIQKGFTHVVYGTITLFGQVSQPILLYAIPFSFPVQNDGYTHNPTSTTRTDFNIDMVWTLPLSLAATEGISFDFFSSGYLDVSVHPVRLVS